MQKNRRSAALEAALTARQESQVEELVTVSLNERVKRRLYIIDCIQSVLFRIIHRFYQQTERERAGGGLGAFCHQMICSQTEKKTFPRFGSRHRNLKSNISRGERSSPSLPLLRVYEAVSRAKALCSKAILRRLNVAGN